MGLHARTRSRLSGVALLVALAAGCGGGGGGGDAPADPPSAPPPPAGPQAPLPALKFGEFPSAAVVIGQESFTDNNVSEPTTPSELNRPIYNTAVTPDGRLFVVEGAFNKVKVFANYDAVESGASADLILDLSAPSSLSMQGNMLVAVTSSMVHIYNTAPSAEVAPDITVGDAAPGCDAHQMSDPHGAVVTPLGQLVVADTENNRVLIWNSVQGLEPTRPADIVLGQARTDTCKPNDEAGDGDDTPDPVASRKTMNAPESVWSDGVKLVVVDSGNHRVLIWDHLPTTAGAHQVPADHVIGQDNFQDHSENAGQEIPSAISLSLPVAVDVNERGQMAVADTGNNRVLIWNSVPTDSGVAANQVVGQADMDDNGSGLTGQTLRNPQGVRFHNRNLIVTDSSNNRVLVWRATN